MSIVLSSISPSTPPTPLKLVFKQYGKTGSGLQSVTGYVNFYWQGTRKRFLDEGAGNRHVPVKLLGGPEGQDYFWNISLSLLLHLSLISSKRFQLSPSVPVLFRTQLKGALIVEDAWLEFQCNNRLSVLFPWADNLQKLTFIRLWRGL